MNGLVSVNRIENGTDRTVDSRSGAPSVEVLDARVATGSLSGSPMSRKKSSTVPRGPVGVRRMIRRGWGFDFFCKA